MALLLAVALLGLLIALATLRSRGQVARLRVHLDRVESESLDIADQFRRTLRELSSTLLAYGMEHDASQWTAFVKASAALDLWIDEQKRHPSTSAAERELLEQIDRAYDQYLSTSRELRERVTAAGDQPTPVAEFGRLEQESERLFELGWSLTDAHRQRRTQLLAAARETGESLRWLQLGSLSLLFLTGLGLAAVVYRDMIAPLRLRLVESQAACERHEKLASLGMLAAGVAHEVRNPLTAIKATAFIQQRRARPGSREQLDAELMMREIGRLEHIVNDFLQFARPAKPELLPLPAQRPLQEVQELLAPGLGQARVRVVLEPSPVLRVRADPGQLKQVLINLVQNAADSIGADGTITLRARSARKRLGGRETEVAILEVADTGKGIAPEVAKRLFDPFYTTKPNGTGLGLSIAARIVEEHGGALQFQTQLNVGTTFGIVLPRMTE